MSSAMAKSRPRVVRLLKARKARSRSSWAGGSTRGGRAGGFSGALSARPAAAAENTRMPAQGNRTSRIEVRFLTTEDAPPVDVHDLPCQIRCHFGSQK